MPIHINHSCECEFKEPQSQLSAMLTIRQCPRTMLAQLCQRIFQFIPRSGYKCVLLFFSNKTPYMTWIDEVANPCLRFVAWHFVLKDVGLQLCPNPNCRTCLAIDDPARTRPRRLDRLGMQRHLATIAMDSFQKVPAHLSGLSPGRRASTHRATRRCDAC